MKKIVLILVTVILNIFLFSCSSDDLIQKDGSALELQQTTGDDGEILPPEEEDDGDN